MHSAFGILNTLQHCRRGSAEKLPTPLDRCMNLVKHVEIIADDRYQRCGLAQISPTSQSKFWAGNRFFVDRNLLSAIWSLFVLFSVSLSPTSHTSQLYIKEYIFFSHAPVLLTGSNCMRGQFVLQSYAGCRGPCLAWMPMNNIVWREEIKNAGL